MMKRFVAILFSVLLSANCLLAGVYTPDSVPDVQRTDCRRYTSNPDGILSALAVDAIDGACDSLRRAGKAQIAVVVVDDIDMDDVFEFAYRLFSKWGVGSEDADNGLGILLVKAKREIRFVTGNGLEGILPDAVCKRIQQNYMVGPFSEGDFDSGMVRGIAAVAEVLSGNESYVDSDEYDDMSMVMLAIIAMSVLVLVGASYYAWRQTRCPRCGHHKFIKSDVDLLSSGKYEDLVMCVYKCGNCGYTEERQETICKDDDDGPYIGGGIGGGVAGGIGGMHSGGGFGGGHFGGGGSGSKF